MITEEKLQALFDLWQQRLGLSSWDIKIKFSEEHELKHMMVCHRSENYDCATILVQPYVLKGKIPDEVDTERKMTDEHIEKSVIHELLHCVTRDFIYVTEMVEDWIPPAAHPAIEKAWDRAEEQMVDRLACGLVNAFGQHHA